MRTPERFISVKEAANFEEWTRKRRKIAPGHRNDVSDIEVGVDDHIGTGKIYNKHTFKRMGFSKNKEEIDLQEEQKMHKRSLKSIKEHTLNLLYLTKTKRKRLLGVSFIDHLSKKEERKLVEANCKKFYLILSGFFGLMAQGRKRKDPPPLTQQEPLPTTQHDPQTLIQQDPLTLSQQASKNTSGSPALTTVGPHNQDKACLGDQCRDWMRDLLSNAREQMMKYWKSPKYKAFCEQKGTGMRDGRSGSREVHRWFYLLHRASIVKADLTEKFSKSKHLEELHKHQIGDKKDSKWILSQRSSGDRRPWLSERPSVFVTNRREVLAPDILRNNNKPSVKSSRTRCTDGTSCHRRQQADDLSSVGPAFDRITWFTLFSWVVLAKISKPRPGLSSSPLILVRGQKLGLGSMDLVVRMLTSTHGKI
ncbi:hypothetical protein M9H77_18058 [Catharanthus roseus]|uniref:Uncharacterized protein n=1 Tax=Catharanthus roseus TaxID=4058 RepID=A0ACC0B6E4_CATRO|nr:hypothetical protein M9H77_18058 [Catharanthus roseus]